MRPGRHPVDGVVGSKPRVGGSSERTAKVRTLSEEYLRLRNDQQRLKNLREAMAFAKARGELISKRLATLQATFLLGAMREKMLHAPVKWARRFVGLSDVHAASQLLREMMLSVMTDLRGLPLAVSDAEWAQALDEERLKASKEGEKDADSDKTSDWDRLLTQALAYRAYISNGSFPNYWRSEKRVDLC